MLFAQGLCVYNVSSDIVSLHVAFTLSLCVCGSMHGCPQNIYLIVKVFLMWLVHQFLILFVVLSIGRGVALDLF